MTFDLYSEVDILKLQLKLKKFVTFEFDLKIKLLRVGNHSFGIHFFFIKQEDICLYRQYFNFKIKIKKRLWS